MELKKSRILITGATGGLGAALARELSAAGATLLLTGRDETTLEALGLPTDRCHRLIQTDLTSPDGIAKTVGAAINFEADVLINNAGIGGFSLLEEQAAPGIDLLLSINLAAPIQLTRALLPSLKSRRDAAIVNIGSAFGGVPFAGFAAYSASKAGLHAFSQALRRELADTNIRVIHVSPRAIDTPLNTPAVVALNKALGNACDRPEQVASRIVRMLRENTAEATIGLPERIFSWLNGIAPSLIDRGVRPKLPAIKLHAASR